MRGSLPSPYGQKLPRILTAWIPWPARAVCVGRKPTRRKTKDGRDLPPAPTVPGKRGFRDRQGLSGARSSGPRGIVSVPCNHVAPGNVSRLPPALVLSKQDDCLSFRQLVEHLLRARPCVSQVGRQVKSESLLHGTQAGVTRGNCRIVESQQSYWPLCASVFSSVKWAESCCEH